MTDGVLTLKNYDVGAVKTWVHIPAEYQRWHKVAIGEALWIALMQVHQRESQRGLHLHSTSAASMSGEEER